VSTWPKVSLGELCSAKTGTVDPTRDPDGQFLYIDITSIDVSRKEVTEPRWLAGRDAPSRARRRVMTGDVIVSMTRPNLNAVALISPEHSGQVCSTGFCVLRPEPRLDAGYLFHFVRTKNFVQALTALVSGALYPAVSEGQVRQQIIPLPPLEEQRRIVDILDRAASIRRLRRQAQDTARQIIPALFNKMFGDPATNPRGWPVEPLGEVVAGFEGGRNLQADAENGADGTLRILKVSAVTSGSFRATESKPAPPGYMPPAHHFVRDGDLLISRANTAELVGATALVRNPPPFLLLPDKIWRILWRDPSPVTSEFLLAWFKQPGTRTAMSRLASGTSASMRNISQGRLSTIGIILPPLKLQLQFASQSAMLERVATDQGTADHIEHKLTGALQANLFSA
jgi:type I restriction enzyme S subunit